MVFDEALKESKSVGASRCSDAAAMASFCEHTLQLLVGAVSPQLVWEGAMKQGMTFRELAELANRDPMSVADLMWV